VPLVRLDLARQAGMTHFVATESVVSTVGPALGVSLADFPAEPVKGDTLVREGLTYRVDDIQPDGEGGADLILHRV
jgi:hypothetical protein